jgi:hypothetical protein
MFQNNRRDLGAVTMQPSHQQPYMTPSQRRMFQNNRRDLGEVTVEAERNSSVSENKSMQKYLWLRESGASYHLTVDTAGMYDCSCIHSYLKIGHDKCMYSSRIVKKKVTIVQANGSILDLIMYDCIYVPDICIKLLSITKALIECWTLSNHGLLMVLIPADFKITFDQTLKTTHGYVCGVTMLQYDDSKGDVLDITAREQCCSPFGGEPVLNYTPDKPFRSSDILSARSEIYFAKSSFHLLNSDPNFKQHIATHNLIDWTAITMKDNLVNFETRFKHCLFLEDKDPIPEDWKRSKFKELVTSDYGEQLEGCNQMKWYKLCKKKPDGGKFPIKYLHFQNDTLFHGSRLITFVNLLLSWGAQV